MKNYLNQYERTQHIVLLGMAEQIKELQNSDALTEEEKTYLKYCKTYLDKFNASMVDRFGEAYRRKIVNTLKSNKIRLVGEFEPYNKCVGESVVEDIQPCIDQLQMMNCFGCEKCDYKNCAVYNMCLTCDIDGKDNDGCPYKMD